MKKTWFETTLCWKCPTVYPMDDRECPHCHAPNANVDFEAARIALEREREDYLVSFIEE